MIVLSRGAVAFSGPPSDAGAHFASIGRPFPRLEASFAGTTATTAVAADADAADAADAAGATGGGDERGGGAAAAWGVNPTDAILDVIGEAEAGVDRDGAAAGGRGVEGGGGLVVMSRELLVRQVGGGEEEGRERARLFVFCLPWLLVTVVFGKQRNNRAWRRRVRVRFFGLFFVLWVCRQTRVHMC